MNAKEELIEHIEQRTVKCAYVTRGDYSNERLVEFPMKIGGDLQAFLDSLNFNYDNGYGGQELYGTVWYTDGTWSERSEYDGSEWWEHRVVPGIPDELK